MIEPANSISTFDEFLSKMETAKVVKKAEATLDRWHRERVRPPRTKIGRTVLYRRESLRAWMLAQEEQLAVLSAVTPPPCRRRDCNGFGAPHRPQKS